MKVFIHKNHEGEWTNINNFSAMTWFKEMGYEVVPFTNVDELLEKGLTKETPVVGGIGNIQKALDLLGVPRPDMIDIPECLEPWTHRKIWTSTLEQVKRDEHLWPVFVKPLKAHKLFTGFVLRNFVDLFKTLGIPEDTEVLCSEPVNFDAEYRTFILNGELLDMRRYKGALDYYPDIQDVQKMIDVYAPSAPCAFSLDVGRILDADGKVRHNTALVEVNDSYALGIYGLPAYKQVKMIIARWKEMVK